MRLKSLLWQFTVGDGIGEVVLIEILLVHDRMFIRVALVGLAQTFVVQLSVSFQLLIRGLVGVTDVEQFGFIRERHSAHGVSECLLFGPVDEADELLLPNIEDPIVELQKVDESALESFLCQVYLAELEGSLELLKIDGEISQL